MFPFGHGDGGGGPTQSMLELAGRARSFPGLPACRQGLEESWFDDVNAAGPELPAWVGELYLETHRGTYTTQSPIKKANRANELALRDAELFTSIAEIAGPNPRQRVTMRRGVCSGRRGRSSCSCSFTTYFPAAPSARCTARRARATRE